MDPHTGRSAYTAIEDRALIRYVRKHGKSHGELSTKGNALYKKMEKEKVTKHPWQSMKSRYLRLANDLNERFKFCQMMKAKSKDTEIPVLTHPSRKSELSDGIELRSRRLKNKEKPSDKAQEDVNVSDLGSTNNEIINFCKTLDGRKRLRLILMERNVKNFMLKYNLDFKEALMVISRVNGSIEEAEYYVQHGERRDGSKLLSREEDKILFEGDKDKLTELSIKHGSEVISARLNFLHNEHSS